MKQADLFNVEGHVALVTGAASGLGLAFAEVMADNGALVVLTDIDAAGLDQATACLRERGCRVEQAVVDIADADALRAAIDGAAARHGRLDAVFANAGISSGPGFALSPSGQIDAGDLSLFERAIEVNLTATFLTIRFAAAHMKRQRRGSIVATTSIAGRRADPLVGYGYVGAKAAINNIVRQAAVELAPHNVCVNAIAPGPFLTNIAGGRLHRGTRGGAKIRRHGAARPSRRARRDQGAGAAPRLAGGKLHHRRSDPDRRRRHREVMQVLLDDLSLRERDRVPNGSALVRRHEQRCGSDATPSGSVNSAITD
jgi:NAD(P)-dependent dehydrogenase (short-subunit alcohol dehydrogenase family)